MQEDPAIMQQNIQPLQRAERILNSIDIACYELDGNYNFTYINIKAEQVFAHQRKNVLGVNIWKVFPEFVNTGCYNSINLAIVNKQASTHEFISDITHTWISLTAKPAGDGALIFFTEINDVKETQERVERQQRQINIAKEAVSLGYFKFYLADERIYWDDEMYQLFGLQPQSEQMTPEKIISLVHPDEQKNYREYLERSFEAQKPFQYTYRIITSAGEVREITERGAFLKDEKGQINRIHGLAQDITEQEQAKREQKESRELLQSVFDTTLIGMSVLEAIYNESGEIEDFRIKMVSKELENETHRNDLVGKLYSLEYPGIKEAGLFDLMLQVMKTGEPGQMEYYYGFDGFDKWFSCMFIKKNNGLIATNLDITPRKLAEQEKFRNLAILQQSEELAKMGSWEYDLVSEEFNWSGGMYGLFNLPKDVKVKPKIYLEYVTEEHRPIAERVVSMIKSGVPEFKEKFQILVNDVVKTIKIKAVLIDGKAAKPPKMIGVDIDITEQVKLKHEKRQLEMQQAELQNSHNQRVFLATLTAQEEERKRIAESLHNGVGQLLYGVKLSLEQLDLNAKQLDLEHLKEAKLETKRLLADSIKETRRISHELTPIILEDFGLKEALKDICQQFKQGVTIKCQVTGLSKRLNKHIEIAIYRTVQELVMNVIKHAKATEAFVSINISDNAVSLAVKDNGVGFSNNYSNNGIGLRTIKNKVKLLNGDYHVSWGEGTYTEVSINIPYL